MVFLVAFSFFFIIIFCIIIIILLLAFSFPHGKRQSLFDLKCNVLSCFLASTWMMAYMFFFPFE